MGNHGKLISLPGRVDSDKKTPSGTAYFIYVKEVNSGSAERCLRACGVRYKSTSQYPSPGLLGIQMH
ncbi:hypothetical protein Mapa_010669 [Marchantia paleacea]|nr:hypothetical protein Mapa_010669 [Marchantia paleacea]